VDGWFQILSSKNGNLDLEAAFGALESVCNSSLSWLYQTNQDEIPSRHWENSPCVRSFSTWSGC
jgi:hypothetical protein